MSHGQYSHFLNLKNMRYIANISKYNAYTGIYGIYNMQYIENTQSPFNIQQLYFIPNANSNSLFSLQYPNSDLTLTLYQVQGL
jgi:hypothetical protein